MGRYRRYSAGAWRLTNRPASTQQLYVSSYNYGFETTNKKLYQYHQGRHKKGTGGIASCATKVGKASVQLASDAARKITKTLGGSLTKAAVQETSFNALKKISTKAINVDAAIRTTSRKAIDNTADLMGIFMSKLKTAPTSVFDMISKILEQSW